MQFRKGLFTGLAILCVGLAATHGASLSTAEQKLGYSIGYELGKTLAQRMQGADPAAVAQGVEDVLSGRAPRLSEAEMRKAVQAHRQKQEQQLAAVAGQNRGAGQAFLKKNRSRPGVVQLPSGLQFKVIESGDGRKPTVNDTVVVHYRGALIDGSVFDSTYSRGQPATIPVNGVIAGWQEAMQLMAEGSKWQIFIPSRLAYGSKGAPPRIGPDETLVFEVELIEVR